MRVMPWMCIEKGKHPLTWGSVSEVEWGEGLEGPSDRVGVRVRIRGKGLEGPLHHAAAARRRRTEPEITTPAYPPKRISRWVLGGCF